MYTHLTKSVSRVMLLATAALIPVFAAAQEAPKPTTKVSQADSPSRWDIFAGYSYLAPKGTVNVLQTDGVTVIPRQFSLSPRGVIASGTYFFNKYVGVQAEMGTHDTFYNNPRHSNGGITTVSGGIIGRYPTEDLTPFVHGLVGGTDIGGPQYEPFKWGVALTVGGGVDYETPWLNHRLAIRVFQADYLYLHDNWGPGVFGGRANLNAARLSTGLVFHVGSIAPPPQLTVACSASPTSVFPGDPVNLTATVGDQNPKMGVVYSWSGDGVTGTGANATVNTASLAPGTHTVKCGAKEGKPGKEGLKPWEVANEGTATFTVKEFEPPTISCSASPTTLKPGDSSTVTATGMSPQNRPLTYSYSASAGSVNGTGNTASFSSTGAPTGPTTITCNVSDDKGHNASAPTTVTIEAPPPPPTPHTQALCSITFDKDKKRPTRVDNEAKACLDEVALDLQKQSDAKAVIVGESNSKEKVLPKHHRRNAKLEDFAGERAVNTKEYLVTEKGIDASRVSVTTGSGDDQKVENYLVPAGATFGNDVQGTNPLDESTVKPQVRKPLPERHHHKHAAR